MLKKMKRVLYRFKNPFHFKIWLAYFILTLPPDEESDILTDGLPYTVILAPLDALASTSLLKVTLVEAPLLDLSTPFFAVNPSASISLPEEDSVLTVEVDPDMLTSDPLEASNDKISVFTLSVI
jgi:hypothetical protein